ncbi:MAG: aminoacyl-histidine dipeptidase [Vicingaceae bacterium]
MPKEVAQLEPQILWNNFNELNKVPRPSKKEERVIKFIQDFGAQLGLDTKTDEVGNVVIKKPASQGMEDRKELVLQSHLDMVCQKNNDTQFDFDTQGIEMYIDDDWVKAKGTTLGADNGIGVATMMALLESTDIPHPAFEALFTIDEETGMTGAFGLKSGWIEGDILLNLDTEDDDELTIGCAGGVNVNAETTYEEIEIGDNFKALSLILKGLSGGHSGMEIHKGLGNANKLMNRLLSAAHKAAGIQLASLTGGSLRNAIPRESDALIVFSADTEEAVKGALQEEYHQIKLEYEVTDPEMDFKVADAVLPAKASSALFTQQLIQAIYAVPVGIYRMSPTMPDTVQTSNSLAQINMGKGEFEALSLCRSAVDSEKWDEVNAITAAFKLMDAEVTTDGDYPGWTPSPQSDIVEMMQSLYREKFQAEPRVMAGHGGLECGIIGSKYPEMDMVSFGPNIRGPHSPDEKVQISSVQKFWDFLLDTIKQIPKA